MDLSIVAVIKLGKDSLLYSDLRAAAPDTQFTPEHQIIVSFATPQLTPSRTNEEGFANAARIKDASIKGKQALDSIEGLRVDNVSAYLASATVSGSAKAIAAMLELSEVKSAESMRNVVIIGATGHSR
jgi:hypothetical protein